MLKKSITIFLFVILLIVISIFSLSACNAAQKLEFAFVTDTHIVANKLFTADNYKAYNNTDKMVHLTDAIFNTVADDIIASKTKYVFLGGDMTEYGDLDSHEACINTLNRLKDAGKKVFVINGNHDIDRNLSGSEISPDKFAEIYNDFGYSQSIARYEGSLSYVADLDKNYRLIAIDNIDYSLSEGKYKEDLDDNHRKWIIQQVDKCNLDEKTPILIAHKPLIQQMPKVADFVLERSYYAANKSFISELADKNCKISFTGHMHLQSVKSLTSESDNTFTDVETSSMSFYPSNYRKAVFTKKDISVSSLTINSINPSYVSEFCTEEERARLSDFPEYCHSEFNSYIEEDLIGNLTSENGILGGINFGGELGTLVNILLPNVDKMLNNPLYIKDENDNVSLERILLDYNISLPESTYKTAAQLASFFAGTIFAGDENIENSVELDLLKKVITSLFYYIDAESENIKTALPDYDKINIDLDLLLKEGILECYESNLMPLIFSVAKNSIDNSLIENALESIENDFSALSVFETLIKVYTNGRLEGITAYFSGKNILWSDLLDSIFEVYANDIVKDELPSDNNFTLAR